MNVRALLLGLVLAATAVTLTPTAQAGQCLVGGVGCFCVTLNSDVDPCVAGGLDCTAYVGATRETAIGILCDSD